MICNQTMTKRDIVRALSRFDARLSLSPFLSTLRPRGAAKSSIPDLLGVIQTTYIRSSGSIESTCAVNVAAILCCVPGSSVDTGGHYQVRRADSRIWSLEAALYGICRTSCAQRGLVKVLEFTIGRSVPSFRHFCLQIASREAKGQSRGQS